MQISENQLLILANHSSLPFLRNPIQRCKSDFKDLMPQDPTPPDEFHRPSGNRLTEQDFRSLTGVMAHEIRNTLTPILTLLSVLRESEESDERRVQIEALEQSVKRGVDVVKKLLLLAKGSAPANKQVSLNSLLSSLEQKYRSTLPEELRLQIQLKTGNATIAGDEDLLIHAIDNLLLNVREAMPEGGDLTVTLSRTEDDIHLSIRDTGPGISSEIIGTIWEPFFSTKERKTSAGLGLTVTREVVHSHQGQIMVKRHEPGTEFIMTFPASGV